MFVHIAKIVEHAGNWLKAEGHAAESEIAQAAQRLVNYIGAASELEHAVEVLKKAGFSVMPPEGPPATPNMDVVANLPASASVPQHRFDKAVDAPNVDEVPPAQP